jgi:dipeptidyl aminopeptidase/acylaminoacyl peptidase
MLISGDAFEGEGDFKGPAFPWKNYENLNKYNPARHDLLGNWNTPMLIIHSDLDYRCVVTDGIAAFGVLQILRTPSKFLNFPDEVCLFRFSPSDVSEKANCNRIIGC